MTGVETVTVRAEDGAGRLDRWFRRHYPGLGHGRLEKLLRTGQVRVDGRRARAGDAVAPGQAIRVPPLSEPSTPPPARHVHPEDEELLRRLVLYRDNSAIVLNKPAGLAVQGGTKTGGAMSTASSTPCASTVASVRASYTGSTRILPGVLLIARTAASVAAFFTRAFREKTTRKTYWAVVIGLPKLPQGRIDLALAKHAVAGGIRGAERVEVDDEAGKSAVTYYRVMDHVGDRASWLALLPITGRTHQLRAHCAALGTPIMGDGKYGGSAAHLAGVVAAKGLHLHARVLAIPSPEGGTLRVTAPLPPHMRQTWDMLGFASDSADPFAELETPR